VKKFWRYAYSFRQNTRTWRTRRTDTADTARRHRPRLCVASRGKNVFTSVHWCRITTRQTLNRQLDLVLHELRIDQHLQFTSLRCNYDVITSEWSSVDGFVVVVVYDANDDAKRPWNRYGILRHRRPETVIAVAIAVVRQVSCAGGDVCGRAVGPVPCRLQSAMTVARLDMHNQALIPCIVDEQAPHSALMLLLLMMILGLILYTLYRQSQKFML